MNKVIVISAVLVCGVSTFAFAQQPSLTKVAIGSAVSAAASSAASGIQKLLDINSVSAKDLAALPKIGEAKAKAIIAGRPWSRKDDLVKKNVLTQSEYDAIKDLIIAKQDGKGDKK